MEKQEVLNELEEIKDTITGWDVINKTGIDIICEKITNLQWQLNVNTEDF